MNCKWHHHLSGSTSTPSRKRARTQSTAMVAWTAMAPWTRSQRAPSVVSTGRHAPCLTLRCMAHHGAMSLNKQFGSWRFRGSTAARRESEGSRSQAMIGESNVNVNLKCRTELGVLDRPRKNQFLISKPLFVVNILVTVGSGVGYCWSLLGYLLLLLLLLIITVGVVIPHCIHWWLLASFRRWSIFIIAVFLVVYFPLLLSITDLFKYYSIIVSCFQPSNRSYYWLACTVLITILLSLAVFSIIAQSLLVMFPLSLL